MSDVSRDKYCSMRLLDQVPRWAVMPLIRPKTVAEHTFHVCWITMWLYEKLDERKYAGVSEGPYLVQALFHDSAEATTGDAPTTAKMVDYSELDRVEALVKLADIFSMYVELLEERDKGSHVTPIFLNDVEDKVDKWIDACGRLHWPNHHLSTLQWEFRNDFAGLHHPLRTVHGD